MTLIKCKDCGTDVSDSAQMCPKCAAPLKGAMHDGATTTMQFTGKKLKLHRLFALIMFIIGVYLMTSDDETLKGGGFLCILISIVWAIINKIKKWWHHD